MHARAPVQRKKWIHCFDMVKAIIFVASLSDYDKNLWEDKTSNCGVETLKLWEEMLATACFAKTSFILFLNKMDLLEQKIARVPLNVCPAFKNYKGENTYKAASKAILKKCTKLHKKSPNSEELFHHFTCATNTDNVRTIMDITTTLIFQQVMARSGL